MCFLFYLSRLVFTEFFQCEGWCVCVCVCVCTCARTHVHSVVSDSLCPHGLKFTRLLCPWNFPGKNTGVDCHFLLQGIFLVQGWSLCLSCLLHWQVCLFLVEPPGSPCMYVWLLNWLAGLFFFLATSATWETLLYLEDFVKFLSSIRCLVGGGVSICSRLSSLHSFSKENPHFYFI